MLSDLLYSSLCSYVTHKLFLKCFTSQRMLALYLPFAANDSSRTKTQQGDDSSSTVLVYNKSDHETNHLDYESHSEDESSENESDEDYNHEDDTSDDGDDDDYCSDSSSESEVARFPRLTKFGSEVGEASGINKSNEEECSIDSLNSK